MALALVVNRALKPVRNAVGEAIGEAVADMAGAHGRERQRIIDNTRRVVNIGGSIATSLVLADATGVADAIDGFVS